MWGLVAVTWVICGFLGSMLLSSSGKAGLGFVLGLLFGPLGVIVAGFMRSPAPTTGAGFSPPVDQHADERKCPQCAEWVKREAIKCRFCGSALEPAIEATPVVSAAAPAVKIPDVACFHCGQMIPADATRCFKCLSKVTPAFVGK